MSGIYEWTDRALALPGAPEIWTRASDGEGLIKVDGDEGFCGIASDGTWWKPTGRSDRPWVLVVDHPATEGALLALLGGGGFSLWVSAHFDSKDIGIGRACIAYAEALGRWPGERKVKKPQS